MSKIVIDARESGTSTGRYVDKLVEYLYKLKPSEDVIVLTKAPRLDFFKATAPGFTTIETPYKEFTFGEQIGLLRQLNSLEADLVHFSMVQQPILYQGTAITTMHDLTTARFKNPAKNTAVFTVKQQVYKFVNWLVPRTSKKVIVPSNYVKQDVAKFAHVNPNKIVVTYESADAIKEPAEPIQSLDGAEFIMYLGRPTPHKNLWRLIEAFKDLKATHPKLQLVLAGKKDILYEQIEARVRQAGIKDVIFTGFMSEGQLRWLYEHCGAYVFPSLSEGFGLPGLEAMRHSAPVVSSNATCLPEIYGDAAHYFDPLDTRSITDAINEVLTDKDLRTTLIEKGKKQSAKYSWQRMAEQTLEVYRTVLSKK